MSGNSPHTLMFCSSLCNRLRQLDPSRLGLAVSLRILSEESEDPVTGIRNLFLFGTSLVSIYNLLPLHYPRIKLDLEVFADDEHTRRFAVALFAMNAEQFLQCARFSYDDLKSEAGLQKAVQAVHLILDKCSEAGQVVVKQEYPGELVAVSPTRSQEQWDAWVKHTIELERQYIQQIGMLEEYSKHPVISDTLGEEIIDYVFPRKFFTFIRKFYIRMECTQSLPWQEQRWGRIFTSYVLGGNIQVSFIAEIYADKHQQVAGLKLSDPFVAKLLDTPFKHLSDYLKGLEALVPLSVSLEHPHHAALLDAQCAVEEKLESIVAAQNEAMTEQKLESLKRRIIDWKGLDPNNPSEFGLFLFEDQLLVRRNDVLQSLSVFLFQDALIYCDEMLPEPSRRGKRKLSSASISNPGETTTENKLNVKGWVRTSRITAIKTSTMERPEGTFVAVYKYTRNPTLVAGNLGSRSKVYSVLTLVTSHETVALACKSMTQMRDWHQLLNRARASGTTIVLTNNPPESTSSPVSSTIKALAKVHLDDSTFMIALSYPVEFGELITTIERKVRRLGMFREADSNLSVRMRNGDGSMIPVTSSKDLRDLFSQEVVMELHVLNGMG
ncbi:Guanine nucleotide exchange factor for Cdc42p [Marasmius crinis-equi]|uniref:Guanine nucleotide exchange factor for Cdc42p n=1 Tax=Marasmius crinis-equi TaxID=585013 RepID=A0ABR3FDR0_9AGAR